MIGIKSLKKNSLTRSILRILGLNKNLEELTCIPEDNRHLSALIHSNNSGAYTWKKDHDARIQAERKKAEVLMEKQRFIY